MYGFGGYTGGEYRGLAGVKEFTTEAQRTQRKMKCFMKSLFFKDQDLLFLCVLCASVVGGFCG